MESIRKSQEEERLLNIAESALEPQGFRVVDLDFVPAGRSLIRFFIDKKVAAAPANPAHVSLEECAEVSRLLDTVLENENFVSGAYDLEVSSPGLDRRLRLRGDFEKAVGKQLKLKLVEKVEGVGANCTGTLVQVDEKDLVVSVDGRERRLALAQVKRANEVWSPER